MDPYFDQVTPVSLSKESLDYLLELGWYRMHQNMFTCSHVEMGGPHRVHWLRFSVHEISDRPSHKKIRRRAAGFHFTIEDLKSIPLTHAMLHATYRTSINFDGAWSIQECLFGEAETLTNIFDTKCISIYDHDQLIAAGYFDVGENAAASILHFFDPLYSRYSLGKYLILITLDYLREKNIQYYYPGYVVEDLPKMNYKLFLGKEQARYFHPQSAEWKYFDESILVGSKTEEDE
ncbi:MAG: hypothetical protein OJF59_001320 [Cytophagales bacterium]|jgi:arginine-tRNA-protein transferase|nr:hypothetical protein [Bacteroidota bacterium]MBS1982333.1 hypothetical protein [Bacteroidota bacterium]WHZ07567.1 MAG: hypothetical protein OJF59_001320 [Cytophagales bacterium]